MNLKTIIKKHWRESNEFYMTIIAIIAFFTFPIWIRIITAIFYPHADMSYIGSSDPGILQYIVLGWLIFSFSWAVVWLTLKFTFPHIMRWADDFMGAKLYKEKPTFNYDWFRIAFFLVLFLVPLIMLMWTITTLMP